MNNSTAHSIIWRRARDSQVFLLAKEAAKQEVRRTRQTLESYNEAEQIVAYLRERGGWSFIIEQAFREAARDYSVEGSALSGPIYVRDLWTAADSAEVRNNWRAPDGEQS